MGHKIHPSGLRLGITQEHRSKWFATSKTYPILLQEDFKIRTFIQKKYGAAGISDVLIARKAFLAIKTSLIPAAPYFFCMKVRILKSSWRRIGYVLEVANHLERCSCVIPNLSPEGCILCPISFVPPHLFE